MHPGKRVLKWRGAEHRFAWRLLRLVVTQSTCQPPAAKTPTRTVQTVLIVGEGLKAPNSEGADRSYWVQRQRLRRFNGPPDEQRQGTRELVQGPEAGGLVILRSSAGSARCGVDLPCQYSAPCSVRQRPPRRRRLTLRSARCK